MSLSHLSHTAKQYRKSIKRELVELAYSLGGGFQLLLEIVDSLII